MVKFGSKSEQINTPQISRAMFTILAGIVVLSAITSAFSLVIFDFVGLQNIAGPWFTLDRMLDWWINNVLGFTIAIVMSLYFYYAFISGLKGGYLIAEVFAFITTSLAIGIYYVVSKDQFMPPLIWLTFKYGAMASVVIFNLRKRFSLGDSHIKKAFLFAMAFAVVSGILQSISSIAFRLYSYQEPNLVWSVHGWHFALGFIKRFGFSTGL